MFVMFIALANDRDTKFTTNSHVAKTLAAVSLSRRSGWGNTAIIMTGGSWLTTLNRLYGAALRAPSAESVVTIVMGRGRTVPRRSS